MDVNILSFIIICLNFVYSIFLIIYLTNASICDSRMNTRDNIIRKIALVLAYIQAILLGFTILYIIVQLSTVGYIVLIQ
jgi:hypothetical protein